NAIQHFITVNDKRLANRFLSLFSKLIRYHLKYYEQDTVALSEELNMLEWYLQLQELRYEDQFEYAFEVENRSLTDQIRIPSLILSALMENAIEKTMLRVAGKGCVQVRVRLPKDRVEFEVFYCTDGDPAVIGERLADYRHDLPNLDAHIEFLNDVKHYNIRFQSKFMETGFVKAEKGICIALSLPALSL
ncbi:MAG: histidine kinase, partial [Phaeodactylibacter sp.]|nr:histidine kinase [Phaeodactylibacter sp.]